MLSTAMLFQRMPVPFMTSGVGYTCKHWRRLGCNGCS